jgi:hypothetical protein
MDCQGNPSAAKRIGNFKLSAISFDTTVVPLFFETRIASEASIFLNHGQHKTRIHHYCVEASWF